MASVTTSRKGTKKRGGRRRTLPKSAAPPRQVSPLPFSSRDATSKKQSILHKNDKRLLTHSSRASIDSDCDTLGDDDKHCRLGTTTRSSSSALSCRHASMQTLAPPPPPSRHLKQCSQWNFSVGEHADKRSHGGQQKTWTMEDFDVICDTGCGCFSTVFLAIDKSRKKHVALKEISMQDVFEKGDVECLRQEVEIQTRLNHKHVLQSFGYFLSKDCITMVLEYARHGNLYELMHETADGKLYLHTARHFVRQVTSALAYLESRHVAHRDVKGENVVLTSESTAKVCDFGYAVRAKPNQDLRTTFCGTLEFVPPEMLVHSDAREYVAAFVDPWSLGVFAYELVMGESPFYLMSANENKRIAAAKGLKSECQPILDRIQSFTSLQRPRDCNQDWYDFCYHLLKVKPHLRMSATDALEHVWLCEQNDAKQSSRGSEKAMGSRAVKRAKVGQSSLSW